MMRLLISLHPISTPSQRRRFRPAASAIAGKLLVLLVCAGLFCCAAVADASTISLIDGNSVVTLDPTSSSGVSSWTVDGVNQLYQQWFWYRIGNSGLQASIDTLGTPTITQTTPSQASVSYAGSNGLTVNVTYMLSGGAVLSGGAGLGESISITNTSGAAQTVHFYQYSNFMLDNNVPPTGDYVQFQNLNAVDQWKDSGKELLAETVITPKPNFREAGEVLPANDPNYTTMDTLYKLNNIPNYTLAELNSNSASAVLGPANVTWAYEWDKSISPNSTFIISKAKSLTGVLAPIPEPSTLTLVFAGLLVLAGTVVRQTRRR
jgi:hypothetical protein